MSENNNEVNNEQSEQISEDHAKAIDHALGEIDLTTAKADDVVSDLMNRIGRFVFELMCAMILMGKIVFKKKINLFNLGINKHREKEIDSVIKNVDLSKISIHEIIIDLVNRVKRFNFELMCAMRLIEKIAIAQSQQETSESEEQPQS